MDPPLRAGHVVIHGKDGSYAVLEVIGRGAYGTVFKGIWREVGRHVAIKRVSRSRLSPDEEKALQTEVRLFKNLKHIHIVNYIEAVDDPKSDYLDIVMEYVEGGSLHGIVQLLRKSLDKGSKVFEENVVADYVRQVVLGLRYLHQQGVVHRDIKGANILVTKESHVKLTDFGVSSTNPQADLLSAANPLDVAGSPYWMAPEIISLTGSSTASDIWSLGCTVIELLTGFPPYHELSDVTALFRIVSDECPPLPTNLSAECEDFLRKCFNKDMHTRASADDLLSHRWLAPLQSVQSLDESNILNIGDDRPAWDTGLASNSASNWGGLADNEASTQATLGKYEEDADEDFDDLDFGEDSDAQGPPIGDSVSFASHNIQGNGEVFSGPISDDISAGIISPLAGNYEDTSNDMRRLSIRDDPFQDVMDDPEADLERERLRRQKEQWALVKAQAASLGKSDDEHIAACQVLVQMFKSNPEQRYYLIYDPGLLPIIEVLESGGNGSDLAVEAMLRVTLSLLDDEKTEKNGNSGTEPLNQVSKSSNPAAASFGYPRVSNIREDLCLAGFLPVVMQYSHRSGPFNVRLLSARFLEKMLEWERALHMFIACRGFAVFVEMLEPDIQVAGELSEIALRGIDRMLSMENQRHKRDFCRRFAWIGLLDRIVDGISFNMEFLQKKLSEQQPQKDIIDRCNAHVTKLARLLQTFAARADPTVKAKMIEQPVLYPMIEQIANRQVPEAAVLSILCSVRDLTRDPQTHLELQSASAIQKLVQYLSLATGNDADTKARHFIISSLHNLCIVSPSRQEAAAKAGLVPHLQLYIRSQDINLRSLCIDMYSGLACSGPLARVELSKQNGVDFYVELLVMLSVPGTVRKWQARVLQSLSEWLEDTSQSEAVENQLITERNCNRVTQALSKTRLLDMEGVLEAYLKMITISTKVNTVFGKSSEFISAMVRWLERMYSEEGGGARGRLLLLRTLLAHARIWHAKSGIDGLVAALRLLLTEVVLITDEAITVREQATLLLSALDRIGVTVEG
eukprot:GFKZ01003282.1.p1 GENE.GFKZ01003282.1~~GFKZ01003282.1.p1  ORF type:complete len:1027 (-),score=143.03 GFKZ01003282.1:1309-4389(-)